MKFARSDDIQAKHQRLRIEPMPARGLVGLVPARNPESIRGKIAKPPAGGKFIDGRA